MSTTETGCSSTEPEVTGGLGYDETELTLGLPGAGGSKPSETDRKRGFAAAVGLNVGAASRGEDCGARSSDSSDGSVSGAIKRSAAKAQVVGWPPVRSFRRTALRSCTYVKVAVDGAPYLRKVDLEAHGGYEQLLAALEEMFSCFTVRDYPDERRLVDPVNGTEYVPTYEDKDGDWMLVGDVPWKMFVASCKRLRLMKSSDAINLATRMPQACTNNK